MCNCHSYNQDNPGSGKTPTVQLKPPKEWNSEKESICIDACIADTIQHLWNHGIVTLGCCCGHGRMTPDIVLDQNCSKATADIVRKRITEVDDRDFTLFSWKLVTV